MSSLNYNVYLDLENRLESTFGHWHVFEVQPLRGGRQSSTFSSNIRLALLDRSGTGLFAVYNDRRDTADVTSDELLGRSFIVKYTRLVDF